MLFRHMFIHLQTLAHHGVPVTFVSLLVPFVLDYHSNFIHKAI